MDKELPQPDELTPALMKGQPTLPKRRWAQFLLWARKVNLAGRAEVVLAVLAVISAVATYIAISRKSAPFEPLSPFARRRHRPSEW